MNIMQEWTSDLSLMMQGVLVAAVRGCDGLRREDVSKWLVRYYRACVLECAAGDPREAPSFMSWPTDDQEMCVRSNIFIRQGLDHYPMHWLMHFMFAAEILGYYHPDVKIRRGWNKLYIKLVRTLHVNEETKRQLEERLVIRKQT